MKQHITVKQLKELSTKGKRRLREWWKPKKGDIYWRVKVQKIMVRTHNKKLKERTVDGNYRYPLLSIGRMIELLYENNKLGSDDWNQLVLPTPYNKKDSVCDDLWEAVKEVLG